MLENCEVTNVTTVVKVSKEEPSYQRIRFTRPIAPPITKKPTPIRNNGVESSVEAMLVNLSRRKVTDVPRVDRESTKTPPKQSNNTFNKRDRAADHEETDADQEQRRRKQRRSHAGKLTKKKGYRRAESIQRTGSCSSRRSIHRIHLLKIAVNIPINAERAIQAKATTNTAAVRLLKKAYSSAKGNRPESQSNIQSTTSTE